MEHTVTLYMCALYLEERTFFHRVYKDKHGNKYKVVYGAEDSEEVHVYAMKPTHFDASGNLEYVDFFLFSCYDPEMDRGDPEKMSGELGWYWS